MAIVSTAAPVLHVVHGRRATPPLAGASVADRVGIA